MALRCLRVGVLWSSACRNLEGQNKDHTYEAVELRPLMSGKRQEPGRNKARESHVGANICRLHFSSRPLRRPLEDDKSSVFQGNPRCPWAYLVNGL